MRSSPALSSRLVCARRSATDRTLTVQSSSTPLLGHDPDAWKHMRAHRPEGRQFKLRAPVPVVASGQAAPGLEAVETALDDVAALEVLDVEHRRSSTA